MLLELRLSPRFRNVSSASSRPRVRLRRRAASRACLTAIDPSELATRTSSVNAFGVPSSLAHTPGSAWGDLQLVSLIGQGSFGCVYRAWDNVLAREVALKILTPSIQRS